MFEMTYGTVTFFLTKKTYDEIQKKFREEEEERQRILKEEEEDRFFWNQLREVRRKCLETNDPMLWSIYSDLHKDYYGVRP